MEWLPKETVAWLVLIRKVRKERTDAVWTQTINDPQSEFNSNVNITISPTSSKVQKETWINIELSYPQNSIMRLYGIHLCLRQKKDTNDVEGIKGFLVQMWIENWNSIILYLPV